MKIIFTSNISWSIFNFRKGLMEELRSRGHEVIFCATPDEYTAKLEARGFRFVPINVDRKGTNFFKDLGLIIKLYKIYRREKPGLVFHNSIKPNTYGSIAAKLAGVKCVNTVSGLGYIFIQENIYFHLVKFLYTLACAFSEKTFFQNKDDMGIFLSKKIVREDKAALVKGSGVDVEFFSSGYCKNRKKEPGVFLFSFIGRILRDKGITEFIDAAVIVKKKYPSARFNIIGMIDKGNPAAVGAAEIDDWHRTGIAEYGGEVSDVRPFICEADCVVLPSYREGTPKSLLEASAMEKPIITTDAAGCREVVEDGVTGFAVPVKDAERLAAAMQRLIELPAGERAAMGRSGRGKIVNEFSEKQVISAYLRELSL
ncbi:MAG: glycosyltransferase family 4 protein [Candidatus Omnitrophica bacterium]|nr:glycosyltransferase family 4 protein [Candidatus Omnitrophota bacterium]